MIRNDPHQKMFTIGIVLMSQRKIGIKNEKKNELSIFMFPNEDFSTREFLSAI